MIRFVSLYVEKILKQCHVLLVFIDEELVTEFSFSFVQIRGWKAWEEETSSHGYEFANGMMSNDVFNCFSSSVEFLNFTDEYTILL